MPFKFEYLGEFKFIFKNNLGSGSGDQIVSSDEKIGGQKSHASVFFSAQRLASEPLHYLDLKMLNVETSGDRTSKQEI
jgi:hypothetical protein